MPPDNYLDSTRHLREMMQSQEANRRASLGMADVLYDRLMEQVADFESTLTADQELGACLAAFGRDVQIRVEAIGYQNPYFVVFYGRTLESETRVQLVQHTTQLNLLFVAVPRNPDHPEPARIGFHKTTEG